MNKVIPSIKRNKNIIPSAILSLGNKVNNDQYFQNSKLYKKKVKFFLDKSYDTVYINIAFIHYFIKSKKF